MDNQQFHNFQKDPRINWKSITIVFIVALFVLGGVFSYAWLTREKFIPESSVIKKGQEKTEGAKNFLYYYSQYSNIFTLYALNFDISLKDQTITRLKGEFSMLGNFLEKGKILVCEINHWPCGNKLYILDTETGELKDFLSIEEGKRFTSAILSHNKNSLVYALYSGENIIDGEGEVWIYDLKKKNHRKIFERKPLMLYAVLRVLGWNSEDNKLVIQEIGGDAGDDWGDIYLVDTNKTENNYKKIETGAGKEDFLVGKLSPNGENFLYIFCEKPTSEVYASEEVQKEYFSCEAGAEILIYNFAKSSSSSIYRNLTHFNNTYKRKLRIINSVAWQDDENIIFSIPDGIYKINLKLKREEKLHGIDWLNPDGIEISKFLLRIIYAGKDFVIYSKQDTHGYNLRFFILNLTTKKVMELGEEIIPFNGFLDPEIIQ